MLLSQHSNSPHCATGLMPISRALSGMPIGDYVSWGRLLAIIRALMLNPRHCSAHEHLGEAYLVLGESAKAEQLLAALEKLCLIPCEEYDDLKRVIAAYT